MLSSQWREELDRRIHTLTALRDQLDGCIGCGCLSRRDCPLRNPGDKLGKREPAPGCWKTSDKTKAPQLGAFGYFPVLVFRIISLVRERVSPTSTSLSIAQSVDGGSGLRRHFNYGICRRFFLTILLKFSRQ